MKFTFFLASLALSVQAQAFVINPIAGKTDPAVVMLDGLINLCSGSVVGLEPVTIVTAKHCVEAGAVNLGYLKPKTILTKTFRDEPFSVREGILPGDLAILIYAENKMEIDEVKNLTDADLFYLDPQELKFGQDVEFCGYGGTRFIVPDNSAGELNCGKNKIILDNKDLNFEDFLIPYQGKNFDDLSVELQTKTLQSMVEFTLETYGAGTRLGFTNLPGDPKQSLVQVGDSGGPIFIRDSQGHKQIIAVSSAGGAVETQGALRPVMSIGWRLNGEWTKNFLEDARKLGADF
jgi:hypothetical protein